MLGESLCLFAVTWSDRDKPCNDDDDDDDRQGRTSLCGPQGKEMHLLNTVVQAGSAVGFVPMVCASSPAYA